MKRQILSGLASLAMASAALGRTDPEWVNNSVLVWPPGAPPMIDATNFVNKLAFIDNTFNSLFVSAYQTANTVNYTNLGVLASLTGFRFDTYNSATDRYTNAANFYNGAGAIINCGGTNYGGYFSTNALFYSLFGGGAECLVWATNIINRGTIDMGSDSLLSLQGQNVSLSGGLLNMEGFESGNLSGTVGVFSRLFSPAGMFDGYWGAGQTPPFSPASYFGFGFPLSPPHWVTNRNYTTMQTQLSLPQANAYVNQISLDQTNTMFQVVFLQNMDTSIGNNVYFAGDSVVEWVWPSINIITGMAQTNHMYLFDSIMSVSNLVVMTNGIAPPNTGYRPTYIPTNYFFFQGDLGFLGPPATPGLQLGSIGPATNITTEFSAYEALFQPTTVIVSDVAGQTYSNMPGRIEITADKQLDLRSSRISGLNYVQITATNNFTRDANTRILTAVADYNLGVTNATLTVSNLMAPTCPRLDGYVNLFSTRWTNVVTVITPTATNTVNNIYFVTMVDSHLASTSPTALENLRVRATNVIISDVLNVLSSLTIDAYNVTITTNGPGALAPAGQLNFNSGQVLGPSVFPRLLTLTNHGVISAQNTATFGAAASPLWDFVNHGSVLTLGCSIWATNFENTGRVDAGPGPIYLTATSAALNNGVFNAPLNDIIITSGSLLISNQVLNAGHGLIIQATNSLTDNYFTNGGLGSGNVWSAGLFGFNLPFEPPIASLLGTTITDTAPTYASVPCQWAGQDLGPVVAGYSNNAALGRLILDGAFNSSFVFSGPATNNALYVDYLELRNYMTNFDSSGNLANLYFDPGMKIYYAQLILNGVSWAEKLNGKNGGGLNWVAAYAGTFSSTNMVYPDGTTNRLNLALVQSCSLDSNGNGSVNCEDLAPVFVPSQMNFTAAFTNAPQRSVVLSWDSIPSATNSVFFQPSVTAADWQLLTNFVSPAGGRQRVVDPIGAGGRFYRVLVDLAAP